MNELVLVFILCLLLGSSAYLAASEISLFSLSPLVLRSYKTSTDPKKKLIAHLMDHPRDVLVTILMLNVLANLLVQNAVSSMFDRFADWMFKVGVPLVLTLVFGEVLPKSIALPHNQEVALRVAPVISRLMRVLTPIRKKLNAITGFLARMIFLFLREEREISPEELRHVAKTSAKSGVLNVQEAELIIGALDLKESIVKEQMRPREEVLFYDINESLAELLHLFVHQQCSRVPVCDGQLDRLLGILSTKQYFLHQDRIQASGDLLPILQKPYYVPESMRSWPLLQDLRDEGEEMAIVVDEYGSISGLITQEDLIEMVVGEIADRRDEKLPYTRSGHDVIIASGKLELNLFEDLFGVRLISHEHVVTLGGWLTEQLGDIPTAGTKYATDEFLFYVLAADPNRVRRIYVRKLQKQSRKAGLM